MKNTTKTVIASLLIVSSLASLTAAYRPFGLGRSALISTVGRYFARQFHGTTVEENIMEIATTNLPRDVERLENFIRALPNILDVQYDESPLLAAALITATLAGHVDIVCYLLTVPGIFNLWYNNKFCPSSDTAISQARDLAIELGHDGIVAIIDKALAKL